MLRKSLYLRIVVTFISVVIISSLSAYLISSLFFHDEVIFEEEMINGTAGVAELFEITERDKIPALVETLQTFYFDVLIVNEDGTPQFNQESTLLIPEAELVSVLNSREQVPIILPHRKREATRIVGVPIEITN